MQSKDAVVKPRLSALGEHPPSGHDKHHDSHIVIDRSGLARLADTGPCIGWRVGCRRSNIGWHRRPGGLSRRGRNDGADRAAGGAGITDTAGWIGAGVGPGPGLAAIVVAADCRQSGDRRIMSFDRRLNPFALEVFAKLIHALRGNGLDMFT